MLRPFFFLAASVAGRMYDDSRAEGVVLVQMRATKAPLGSTAALTEQGYQNVASLQSDTEMQLFMERVLAAEARSVLDWTGLAGTVPYYSGTKGTQDLESMKTELRSASWAGEGGGRVASLTPEGYKEVVGAKNNAQMKAFMRRILDKEGLVVTDEASFNGVVPFYSGVVGSQTFQVMRAEVLNSQWALPLKDWDGVTGETAPLNELGYELVAKMQKDDEMRAFIVRLLSTEARHVKDEFGLHAMVPFFSGTKTTQDMKALKVELRDPKHDVWLADGVGRTADLSEEGYQKVAAQKSDVQMKAFIRRALVVNHMRINEEGGLSGFVPYYSGRFVKSQTYKALLEDLETATWAVHNGSEPGM